VSHRAKDTCLWFFAVAFTVAVALRVEAAVYARRIVSVVTALSTLQLPETTKAETLRRLPALRRSDPGPYGALHCPADECFESFIANGLPGRLLWGTGNEVQHEVLRWWGFRAEGLDVYVYFTSGKVSYFAYHLILSAPGIPASIPPPPPDGKLGAVIIGVYTEPIINVRDRNSTVPVHPPYRFNASSSQSIGIALTPDTPEEVVRAAFDLRLNCVWSLGGCRRWSQLLPPVEPLTRN
jgi:hypothetical protein